MLNIFSKTPTSVPKATAEKVAALVWESSKDFWILHGHKDYELIMFPGSGEWAIEVIGGPSNKPAYTIENEIREYLDIKEHPESYIGCLDMPEDNSFTQMVVRKAFKGELQ